MSDQITYDDKADLIVDTTIDDMFKVSASDMNEIKNVVNANAQEMDLNKAEVQDDITVINNNITDLNNNKLDINAVLNQASTDTNKTYSANYLNDKLVSVGTTAPTDGRKVWFKIIDNSIVVNNQEWYSKPKVLWTNPNPTSVFASQTITLNDSLANYSYYEVLYKTYKDENIGYNTGKIPTNWGTNIYGMVNANDGGVRSRVRSVTINSSTQIGISSCSLINTKGDAYTFPNDDRLIPFKILGYKE
jgi:hypothetical protein